MKIANLGQKALGLRGFISLRLIHRLWKDCLRGWGWHVQPTVSNLRLLPGFGCSGPGLAYTLSWAGRLRDRQEWLSMEHLTVQNQWSGWRHAWLSQQSGCTDNQWVEARGAAHHLTCTGQPHSKDCPAPDTEVLRTEALEHLVIPLGEGWRSERLK